MVTFLQSEVHQEPLSEAERRAARQRRVAGKPGDRRDRRWGDIVHGGGIVDPGRVSSGNSHGPSPMIQGSAGLASCQAGAS
jgi:hypothetical protein